MSANVDNIVQVAEEAAKLEPRPEDASALLIDAAAMLVVDADMSPEEATERLTHSIKMFNESLTFLARGGVPTTQ